MSQTSDKPDSCLPGYELIEKIGAGGFGEVWSAEAPGGLRKAVKYVFGNEFDKRAKSEMHALEKIKSVRHPFLLSLERIEVLDGRLVVVSELADASLRDRFCDCVRQGLPGIPREELLGYLADAADALDYIGREHDLAHLDIKPENLLLLAGHVKVADFGLVKSVADQTQASLVGGMTPTYAAPEVFQGSPCRQSDQYSLAILYQEMLVGAVPFPGSNAAELTLQHMNEDPDLSRLGEGDRFAIARALAKDPSHRYASAKEMVEAIRTADASAPSFGAEGAPSPEVLRPRQTHLSPESKLASHSATEVFAETNEQPSDAAADALLMPLEPLAEPTPREAAPPADVDLATPFEPAPALFIGIGASGARVLRSLRNLMNQRLECEGPPASTPLLLLDTDARTLASATRGIGLDASETISLPLRRPQAYREKSDLLLRWLGRRWLYNIPRSMLTEGIRPLGRLGLIDHARQTFQRIRGVVSEAVSEASRDDSREATGLPFKADAMRVYVVASSSGGAGSGMSIDIAYAVRAILDRVGVANAKIIGLMTHSTHREAKRGELARVNSYAWLSEFEKFRTSDEGYPGDQGVGLPAHDARVAAFDHTYFLPLGEQLDTPAFESASDEVADYLFADAFTPAQRVLDAVRAEATDAHSTVRSFAVSRPDAPCEAVLSGVEQAAVSRMLQQWSGGGEGADAADDPDCRSTDQVVHGAVAFLGKTQLDSPTLASNCRSLLEASLGGDATAYVDSRFGALDATDLAAVGAAIDRTFGIDAGQPEPTRVAEKRLSEIVGPIGERLSREAVAWVLGRVNDTQERLDGADRAAQWLTDYLRAAESEIDKMANSVVAERTRWIEGWEAKASEPAEALGKLFEWRLDEASLVAVKQILATLVERIEALPSDIESLRAVVSELTTLLVTEADQAADPAEVERLAVAIEQRLQADYLSPSKGLLEALSGDQAASHFGATIHHVAKMISREDQRDRQRQASGALGDPSDYPEAPLGQYGGEFRRLDLTRGESDADDQPQDRLLVTEMAGVSLKHVAADLIGRRRDYAAFAERVRTRRDVPWTDLVTGGEGKREEPRPVATILPVSDSLPAATAVID